jgi:PKD repeat protein
VAYIIDYQEPLYAELTRSFIFSIPTTGSSAPVAQFTYEVDRKTVVFTNTSREHTGGDLDPETSTVLWNFGDGNTSTEISPTHTYAQPGGTFSVSLVVTNANGVTHEDTAEITTKTRYKYRWVGGGVDSETFEIEDA